MADEKEVVSYQDVHEVVLEDLDKRVYKFQVVNRHYPSELLIKALEITGGNISRAARLIGCNPRLYWKVIADDPEFGKAVEDIRNEKLDFAEDVLWNHIKEHNLLATMFYLKTIGKKRGYTTETKIVGDKDKPVVIQVNVGNNQGGDDYA